MKKDFFSNLFILSVLIAGCGGSDQDLESEQIRPAKFGVVEKAGGAVQKTYPGITQSASLTELSFRSGGLLIQINAVVGKRVNKGSLLAMLDQKDVKLAYDQALADVQNAKAQYDAASSSFDRIKQLYETDNASLNDYDAAKSSLSSAQTAYEISLKKLDLQKSQIEYTEIIAPMSGIVTTVNSKINEVVQSGRTIIVMSNEDESDMEVQVGMPERYIDRVNNGDKVSIKIGSIDQQFTGLVTEVGYTSSSSGVTYPVIVSVNTEGNKSIRPDMPADVTFYFGSVTDQSILVAPLKAIFSGVDGNYVYKLEPDSAAETYVARKQKVALGTITKDGYIVREGLQEGDLLAVAGLRSFYEGRKVKLLEDN